MSALVGGQRWPPDHPLRCPAPGQTSQFSSVVKIFPLPWYHHTSVAPWRLACPSDIDAPNRTGTPMNRPPPCSLPRKRLAAVAAALFCLAAQPCLAAEEADAPRTVRRARRLRC